MNLQKKIKIIRIAVGMQQFLRPHPEWFLCFFCRLPFVSIAKWTAQWHLTKYCNRKLILRVTKFNTLLQLNTLPSNFVYYFIIIFIFIIFYSFSPFQNARLRLQHFQSHVNQWRIEAWG